MDPIGGIHEDVGMFDLVLMAEMLIEILPSRIYSLTPISCKETRFTEITEPLSSDFELVINKFHHNSELIDKRESIVNHYKKLTSLNIQNEHEILRVVDMNIDLIGGYLELLNSLIKKDPKKPIFFNKTDLGCDLGNDGIPFGGFLWNKLAEQPVLYTRQEKFSPSPIFKQEFDNNISKFLPVSQILGNGNNNVQHKNNIKETTSFSNKPNFALLIPKMDIDVNEAKCERAITKCTYNSNIELFCFNFNLAVFIIKKYVLKLKLMMNFKDSELYKEISMVTSGNSQKINNNNDIAYQAAISLLHLDAVKYFNNCHNIITNISNSEKNDFLDAFKQKSNKHLIHGFGNNDFLYDILNFMGQVFVLVRILIKKQSETDPKIIFFILRNVWYIKKEIVGKKNFDENYEFLFGIKINDLDNILDVIVNIFLMYLCYTKYFVGKNYGDITSFCIDSIHFLKTAEASLAKCPTFKNYESISQYIKSTIKKLEHLNNNVYHQNVIRVNNPKTNDFNRNYINALGEMQSNLRFDLKYLSNKGTKIMQDIQLEKTTKHTDNYSNNSTPFFRTLSLHNNNKSEKIKEMEKKLKTIDINDAKISVLDQFKNIIKDLGIGDDILLTWLLNHQ